MNAQRSGFPFFLVVLFSSMGMMNPPDGPTFACHENPDGSFTLDGETWTPGTPGTPVPGPGPAPVTRAPPSRGRCRAEA
jgi:hypothetical protein